MNLPLVLLTSGSVDLERRRARIADADVRLTTTEAALLGHLVANPRRHVSRDELLREVWGYAEGAVSRTVDVTVRRLRAKIEADPANPTHLLSVHGVGYTFIPLDEPAAAAPVPAPPTLRVAPPDEPVGRDAARLAVAAALARGARPVTVAGPAGVGKTRLARALVDDARAEGRTGWLVDLTAAESAEDLALVTAAALGVDRPTDAAIGAALAARPGALLVLDNFEQLAPAAAARVGAWLAAAPELATLVTSRRPLGLPAEEVLRLDPLDSDAAVDLFRRRARRVRPDVALDDTALLRAIVSRLDGLPLAIELAAARVRALSVDELSARLALPFLKDPSPADPRRATLAHALDGSWALLPDAARHALAALSVLPGRTFISVAERLLARLGVDDPLDAIELLVDHSLLRVEEGPPGTDAARLAPFVCVAEYAAPRLAAEVPAAEAWAEALAETLEGWAAAVTGPEGGRAIARILTESDNVVALARRHLAAHPGPGLRAIWAHHVAVNAAGGHPAEVYLVEAAIARHRALGDRAGLAQALSRRVYVDSRIGRVDAALAAADEVAALAAAEPALALHHLRAELGRAGVLRRAERPREALLALDAAVVPPDAGPSFAIYIANERGLLLARLGRLDEAAEAFRRSYDLATAAGDTRRMDAALDHLAMARVEAGRGAEVEPLVRDAIARRRRDGVAVLLSPLWYVLGAIALEAGRLDEAREAFRAEQATGEARGRTSTVAAGHVNLALVALRAGDPRAALAELRAGRAVYDRIDARCVPTVVLAATAAARVGAGEPDVTLDLTGLTVPDTAVDVALLALARAAIARARGAPGADDALHKALALADAVPAFDVRELARYVRTLPG